LTPAPRFPLAVNTARASSVRMTPTHRPGILPRSRTEDYAMREELGDERSRLEVEGV
jgi:hypothetical protein